MAGPGQNPTSPIISGGRAIVEWNGKIVGIFENVSLNKSIGVEENHILGNFASVAITPTHVNASTLNCSGFRIYKEGVGVQAGYPTVAEVLGYQGANITVYDRQNGGTGGVPFITCTNCIPNAETINVSARATTRVTINYTCQIAQDEGDGTNTTADTDAGGVQLP